MPTSASIYDVYHHWELNWYYELEIRNNSSNAAYSIDVVYKNLPPNTKIDGNIGKIEPILANDMRIFNVRLFQKFIGTTDQADEALKNIADVITEKSAIELNYKSESGIIFYTIYHWANDKNRFPFTKL